MVLGWLCCVLCLPPPAPVSSHGALASDAPKSAGPTSKSSPDPAGPLLNPCFRDAQGRCLGQSAPPPPGGAAMRTAHEGNSGRPDQETQEQGNAEREKKQERVVWASLSLWLPPRALSSSLTFKTSKGAHCRRSAPVMLVIETAARGLPSRTK